VIDYPTRPAPHPGSAAACWPSPERGWDEDVGGRNSVPGYSPRRLRAARRKAGMTQRQLAAQLGIARQNVTRWETPGAVMPRVTTLREIAAAIGIPFTELLDDTARGLAGLRAAAGLTQRQLADAAEVPRSTVSALERGEIATLAPGIVGRLAATLDVDVEDVVEAHARTVSAG